MQDPVKVPICSFNKACRCESHRRRLRAQSVMLSTHAHYYCICAVPRPMCHRAASLVGVSILSSLVKENLPLAVDRDGGPHVFVYYMVISCISSSGGFASFRPQNLSMFVSM